MLLANFDWDKADCLPEQKYWEFENFTFCKKIILAVLTMEDGKAGNFLLWSFCKEDFRTEFLYACTAYKNYINYI